MEEREFEAYEFGGDWFIGAMDHDSGPIISVHDWPAKDEETARTIAQRLND